MTETTKHDLVITHVFDAPIQQVWNAWIDPEVIMRWWGPDGFSCPSAEVDFREGGTALVCMRAPKEFGGQDMYNTWVFTTIVPLQQIDIIQNLTDEHGNKIDPSTMNLPPEFPRDQHTMLSFKALGDGKTELVVTEYAWTVGQMMEMSRMGMEQCLDKMAVALKPADETPQTDSAPLIPMPSMKLELVAIPVSDVDRAKAFYVGQLGFHLDHDVQPGNGMRIVQMTPPGSACSVVIGTGMPEMAKMQPGSIKGLHLLVADAHKSRAALIERGVEVSEIDEQAMGIKYVSFSDPDGNSWVFQELPWRSSEFTD